VFVTTKLKELICNDSKVKKGGRKNQLMRGEGVGPLRGEKGGRILELKRKKIIGRFDQNQNLLNSKQIRK